MLSNLCVPNYRVISKHSIYRVKINDALLKKLSACGISGDFYNYIASYLKDQKQYTVVNNANSEDEHLDYGVPLGSILSPNLFSINVDDMPDNIDCDTELFADDTTGFEVGNTVDSVLTNLQSNLEKVENYSSRNLLTLHPDKCEVLIISKIKFVGPLPELKIGGSKCLGITIDEKLSWEPHIETVSSILCQNKEAVPYATRSTPSTSKEFYLL